MTTTNNLLAPAIKKLLNAYASEPIGSLLISGPVDSDLGSVMSYLLKQIYGDLAEVGRVYYLQQHTIEAVRDLLSQLAKTRFNPTEPRIVVISGCDQLGIGAQNALLKGLEEPPPGSHFLLTSNQPWEILPTIISRCQLIKMRKPLKKDLFQLWPDKDSETLEQAYWATDGWPAAMEAYLEETDSPILREIAAAKEFLQADGAKKLKLLFAKGAPSEKEELADFLANLLNGLWRTTRAALLVSASRGDWQKTALWRDKFLIVNSLKESFEKNLNHKIIILNLGLKL